MASFIKTKDHLTVVFDDGEIATVYTNNPNYKTIIKALNDKDWDSVRELADPAVQVTRTLTEHGIADRVVIDNGVVYYDNQPMHNHLTERMLQMLDEGYDVAPLALFLQNLMENVSFRAVNELYGFLEYSELPITEDGHFLAYKRVRDDWMDQWSGQIDNSIGSTPEMPRNEVDEDSSKTCSNGLHFCSRSYLPKYGSANGGRVIVVKINPRDVVAIPKEHHNEKGRCCRYEVINEIRLKSKSTYALPKANLEGSYRPSGTNNDDEHRMLKQVNLETGEVIASFTSPSEAQKMTGIDASGISKVARGKRNSAGGYGWEYAYESVGFPTSDHDVMSIADLNDELDSFDPDDYPDDELWK